MKIIPLIKLFKNRIEKEEDKIINKLEELFKKSVEKVLKENDRPMGLLLSGGIDSGMLAALMKPDVALTCKFSYGEKYDEFIDVERIIKHIGLKGLKHKIIEPTKEDFKKYFKDAVLVLGRTTTHFSLLPLYMIFKRAKEMGLKTLISGEGPDEFLAGYTSYVYLMNEEKLYQRPELLNYKYSIDQYLGEKINRAARILKEDVSKLEPHWNKYEHLLSKLGYCDLMTREIRSMELAMAHHFGINLVYPYMNQEIEQFCFKEIPDYVKIHNFTTKWPMRKVAEKYLPYKSVWRLNKMGGPVAPVGLWLNQEEEFDKIKYIEMQKDILRKNYASVFTKAKKTKAV